MCSVCIEILTKYIRYKFLIDNFRSLFRPKQTPMISKSVCSDFCKCIILLFRVIWVILDNLPRLYVRFTATVVMIYFNITNLKFSERCP